MIYFQSQHEVAGRDGKRIGIYVEMSCVEIKSALEIGEIIKSMLKKFHSYADLTLDDFYQLKKITWEEYNAQHANEVLEYFQTKNDKELLMLYRECGITYFLETGSYLIDFAWFDGKNKYIDFSPSTGKLGLMTFDTPLEFDDAIEPEALGCMVLEAFDRCEQLADMAAGNKFPTKEITLLDESVIEVQMPKDKHFADAEDMGAGEIYQAYEYLPSEDAESSANFYLGIGAELNCDVSAENIRAAWERYYGIAETFEVEEVNCGIYTLRAELRNKKFHRISYFLPQSETLLLECAMELFQPGKRKKLDERLTELFEDFAVKCKRKEV